MTYAIVSVQTPKPQHRGDVLDSMQRYSAVARAQPGSVWTGVVEDAGGRLVGVVVWESEAAAESASAALMAEIGSDPFEKWEAEPIRGYRGDVA